MFALAWNSYRSGGTGAFSWDAPGVLPDATGALPGRSWTHPGAPRQCILSSLRPKRLIGTPQTAKLDVKFVVIWNILAFGGQI